MPPRIQMTRPSRIYMPRPIVGGTTRGAGTGRKGSAGPVPGIDTSSTGNVGGDLVKAIVNSIQGAKMNEVANQILAKQAWQQTPGAQSLGQLPTDGQQTPLSLSDYGGSGTTVGDLNPTGGALELQVRNQQAAQQAVLDKQAAAEERAKLTDELTKARTAESLARTANIGKPKPTKPGKYVAGSGDVQNDPSTDDFNQIQADFDAQHGRGSYAAFAKNLANLRSDGKGNLVVTDSNGNPVFGKDGVTPLYSMPEADGPYWKQRVNATRIKGGQGYLGDLPDGTNPQSGAPSGSSAVNPIPVTTNLQARSLPNGTWVQLPDGSVSQIQRSAQSPQQRSQAPSDQAPSDTEEQAAEQQAQQEDTEDQGDQASAGRQADNLALARNMQPQQPGSGLLYPAQDLYG